MKLNKLLTLGAALALVVIITLNMNKAGADQPILMPHQKVEAVILAIYYHYDNSGNLGDALIDHATVSSNLNAVPKDTNAAEAIAYYKSSGVIIDFASPTVVIMTTPLRDQSATRTTPLVPQF